MTDDAQGKPTHDELLAQAREGIERHRKTDLTVRVVDTDGRPRAGVRVEVRMRRHTFLFGAALFEALADGEPDGAGKTSSELLGRWDELRTHAAALFNFITLPVYWGGYESTQGQTRADAVKRLYEWGVSCGMKTKIHPVVWHQANPDWLPVDAEQIHALMRERIARLATDFGPGSEHPVDFLDFINEPNGIPADFTNPIAKWLRRVGPDEATALAWEACEAFDLPGRGIINHYLREDTFFAVVRALIESGRQPRAIGLQSHQHRGTRPLWNFTEESDRFASLGSPVHWTENSILSGEKRFIQFVDGKADVAPWPSTPDDEQRQARELVDQYTVLFGHPNVEALTQWNFTDARAWLSAPCGLLDKQLQPKPAFTALHKLIRHHWWSDTDLVTDANGEATSRVFSGDYRIRVLDNDDRSGPWADADVNGGKAQCEVTG